VKYIIEKAKNISPSQKGLMGFILFGGQYLGGGAGAVKLDNSAQRCSQ